MPATSQDGTTLVSVEEVCLGDSQSTKDAMWNILSFTPPTGFPLVALTSKAVRVAVTNVVSQQQLIETRHPSCPKLPEIVSLMQSIVIA